MVLKRVKPSKREDQRQPNIPVNIPAIFAKSGPARPGAAATGAAETWYSQRRVSYEPAPETESAPPAPTNGATPPAPAPVTPEPAPEVQPAAVAPAPEPPSAAAPIAPPSAATPAAAPADSIAIPFDIVFPTLPMEVQATYGGSNPAGEPFIVPMAEFEPRMRTGKLRFKWSELRGWCGTPAPAAGATDVEVDLPMATVVPLFLAARKTPDARKKIEIDSRIPDVFGKNNNPAPAPQLLPRRLPQLRPLPSPPLRSQRRLLPLLLRNLVRPRNRPRLPSPSPPSSNPRRPPPPPHSAFRYPPPRPPQHPSLPLLPPPHPPGNPDPSAWSNQSPPPRSPSPRPLSSRPLPPDPPWSSSKSTPSTA